MFLLVTDWFVDYKFGIIHMLTKLREKQKKAPILYICWKRPSNPINSNDYVLSFLSPSIEDDFQDRFKGILLRARDVKNNVKSEAKDLYLDIITNIGIARLKNGKTFRQSLLLSGNRSQWWYHPVSVKDCENEPTFNYIINILTIQWVAKKYKINKLILIGERK